MTERRPAAPDPALAAVQRAALERALLDRSDSRRHLALAGALDVARPDGDAQLTDHSGAEDAVSVLPSALLSLLAVSALDRAAAAPDDAPVGPSVPTTPWQPSTDGYDRCLRRGARLALDYDDVDPERVAAVAGLPASELTADGSNRAKNRENE